MKNKYKMKWKYEKWEIKKYIFFSIIIIYIVFTKIWRNENKKTKKKDHANKAPYHFFINSKAMN